MSNTSITVGWVSIISITIIIRVIKVVSVTVIRSVNPTWITRVPSEPKRWIVPSSSPSKIEAPRITKESYWKTRWKSISRIKISIPEWIVIPEPWIISKSISSIESIYSSFIESILISICVSIVIASSWKIWCWFSLSKHILRFIINIIIKFIVHLSGKAQTT